MTDEEIYHQFIGRYITLCSKVEHSCHVFLVEYYLEHNDKTESFVRDFLGKEGIGFRATLKNFENIVSSDEDYKDYYDREILGSKRINRIVRARNIFAHSHLNGFIDDRFKLLWFNSEYKDDNYGISYTKEELLDEFKFLGKYANKVNDLVLPIMEERYP